MEDNNQSVENPSQSVEGTEKEPAEVYVDRSAEELAKRLKEVSEEAKQRRKEASEAKKRLAELEKQKLEESGQHKELAERWKKEAHDHKDALKKITSAFAQKSIETKLAQEAARMGCVDLDALIRLAPMDQLPIDERFEVDSESLKLVLEDMRKQRAYLFTKPAPSVKDAVPQQHKPKEVNIADLSPRQLAEMLAAKTK